MSQQTWFQWELLLIGSALIAAFILAITLDVMEKEKRDAGKSD